MALLSPDKGPGVTTIIIYYETLTFSKHYSSGLIDEEYIYNKNETIRKWLFFPASYDHRVTTIEEYTKNGLIQYTKYYSNKKYNGTYIIYKYSKKNKNFKNKIILKLSN